MQYNPLAAMPGGEGTSVFAKMMHVAELAWMSRLLKRTGPAIVCERIQATCALLDTVSQQALELHFKVAGLFSGADWSSIERILMAQIEMAKRRTAGKQMEKLTYCAGIRK